MRHKEDHVRGLKNIISQAMNALQVMDRYRKEVCMYVCMYKQWIVNKFETRLKSLFRAEITPPFPNTW